jgi:hypothetical protein
MTKYLCLYRGPATPMEDFTPEQSAEQTKAWGDWMGRVGSALVDAGAPFAERTAVVDNGSKAKPSDQNGYSIVEAESLDTARSLFAGHPFLAVPRLEPVRLQRGRPEVRRGRRGRDVPRG